MRKVVKKVKKAIKKLEVAKKAKKPVKLKKLPRKPNVKTNHKKMSAKDKKFYRALLIERKQNLFDEINNLSKDAKLSPKDASGDMSAYTLHMADVATDAYDREFSLTLIANDRKSIQQIDEALKRLEENRFGACQACGCRINKTRLKALPHAWMCVKCQEKHEAQI